jgi:hypothetical protein
MCVFWPAVEARLSWNGNHPSQYIRPRWPQEGSANRLLWRSAICCLDRTLGQDAAGAQAIDYNLGSSVATGSRVHFPALASRLVEPHRDQCPAVNSSRVGSFMNYLIKLLIPLALGIVAAVINWSVLSSGTSPVYYVTVNKALNVGEPFLLEMASPLGLPPQFRDLSKTIVPYRDRGVLSGRIVRRRIEAGDPIFFADTDLGGEWLALDPSEELFPVEIGEVAVDPGLLRIGNRIRFRVPPLSGEDGPQWIGPFRIVAVGSKINNNFSDDKSRSFSSGRLEVGIAYNLQRDGDQLKRLEAFCDQQRRGEAQVLGVRIVAGR